ncbi:helix-turn-helix transcriptional regulator [Photobacterium sp. DA100]|uniref:helix-turn-helix domain-containing protein n=1 Tax=Photobacterium sp. DA100 TaxID=3027472 RepID=UPI00247AC3F2|nr:helix-turn-helix transcriptional regulator [Photobacterium sp. DA100]WEM40997.1 helix-turn-helix transcriptional regulator [Photobacterium sp. DA100]
MNIVGRKVREIRMQKGLTQEQLAAKCGVIGFDISRGTLAKIESATRQVLDIEVQQLAKALDVSESDLFV